MVGHITYLSDEAMRDKFGRDLKKGKLNFGFDAEFEVESYYSGAMLAAMQNSEERSFSESRQFWH